MGFHNSNEPPLKGCSFLTVGNERSHSKSVPAPMWSLLLSAVFPIAVSTALLSSILINEQYLV